VFRSEDGGSTWIATSQGLSSLYVASLGVAGGRLFAGTSLGQIFVSDDRGSSWVESSSGLRGVHSGTFAFRNGEIYTGLYPTALQRGGVFKSVDGGSTWISTSAGLGDLAGVNSLLFSGNTLFAGTFNGLYRSRDGAVSWVPSGLDGIVRVLVDTGFALFAG